MTDATLRLLKRMRRSLLPLFEDFVKDSNNTPLVTIENNKLNYYLDRGECVGSVEVSKNSHTMFEIIVEYNLDVKRYGTFPLKVSIFANSQEVVFQKKGSLVTYPDIELSIGARDIGSGGLVDYYLYSRNGFAQDIPPDLRTELFAYVSIFALVCQKLCTMLTVHPKEHVAVQGVIVAYQTLCDAVERLREAGGAL